MKILRTAIFLICLATMAAAQSGTGAAPSNSNGSGGFMAASENLRITSPTIGEQIGNTQVTVRYEITNRGADAAPSPTYRVQLDGRDADETLDTSYTYTGLAPGDHAFTVQLVDANHNPIGGSQVIVHFKTFTPGASSPGTPANPGGTATPQTTGALAPPAVIKAKLPLPARSELPDAGSELPLLSLVGFGVLFGGVISAMRGRK
jgi:hypothetical protein